MPGLTNPAEEHFDKGNWGFDGSVWRKLAMLWGFSDTVAELEDDTDADTGTNTLTCTQVPAGEVHFITTTFGINNNTNPSYILIQARIDGSWAYIHRVASPGAGISVSAPNPIVLGPGDNIRGQIGGCTSGDIIRFHITGYKMVVV